MSDTTQLRIPGPTPLPDAVREAGSRQMVNHRGPEFKELLGRVTTGMKQGFQTENDVLILTSLRHRRRSRRPSSTSCPRATASCPSTSASSATASPRSPRATAPT